MDALYLPPILIFLFDLLLFFFLGGGAIDWSNSPFLFFEPNGHWMKFKDGILFMACALTEKFLSGQRGVKFPSRETLCSPGGAAGGTYGEYNGPHSREEALDAKVR